MPIKDLNQCRRFCDAEGDKDADVTAFVALSHQTINRDALVTASLMKRLTKQIYLNKGRADELLNSVLF